MRATALCCTALNQVELREVEIPEPGPGEVLTETVYTCISPGTELRTLSGGQPGAEKRPFILGYANVGRVIAAGDGVDMPLGTLVLSGTQRADAHLLWGGHVSHAVRSAAQMLAVPAGVDPRDAALAKLASIAYHGLRLANARPDEKVAAVGLGPIGMISALLHHLAGADVTAFDLFPERVELARRLGLRAVCVEGDLLEAARAVFPAGADLVIDSTGSPGVLRSTSLIPRQPTWGVTHRDLPRLMLQGSYAGDITLNYNEMFFRECALLFPRDNSVADLAAVFDLLGRGRLTLHPLADGPLAPSEAPEVYRALREEPRKRLTALFQWA